MTIELDHLFICSQVNAPEIDRLLDLGLVEGSSNTHPGQGTANRRIFFANLMLELAWVEDEAEVTSPTVAPTHLYERCHYHETGYSPFGIGLRRKATETTLPFQTWAYKPAYLPGELQIDIAVDTKPNEPLLFVIPFNKQQREPIEHPAGMKQVSGVKITIPSDRLSQALKTIEARGLVKLLTGTENLLTIEFDHLVKQKAIDFRPYLPLKFCW